MSREGGWAGSAQRLGNCLEWPLAPSAGRVGNCWGAKAEAGGPRVEVTPDVRFDQAGGPGLGEKGSESGSTLKVELPGFPHRLDVGAD